MKIIHVQTRWLNAGAEENVLNSCSHQEKKGHNVVIMHGKDFDPLAREIAAKCVSEVVTIKNMVHQISPVADVRAVVEMVRFFRSYKPDIVHTHQSKAGILGRIAARLARVPFVVHGVHILPFSNVGRLEEVVYTLAEKCCAQLTHAFISVSPSVRDECIARGIGSKDVHFVALSAMDVEKFKHASLPSDWNTLLKVALGEAKPPTVVMLASFEPRKRQLEFIKSVQSAFHEIPDWRILFGGEGSNKAEAEILAQELGIGDKICFAGYRTDPESLIALADVCVLTSAREGLPRVVVQYAAAGKAIVVNNLPSIQDIVEDKSSAVVVPANDVPAAAEAVAALILDFERRNELACNAKLIDVDGWGADRMNASIDAVYGLASGSAKSFHSFVGEI